MRRYASGCQQGGHHRLAQAVVFGIDGEVIRRHGPNRIHHLGTGPHRVLVEIEPQQPPPPLQGRAVGRERLHLRPRLGIRQGNGTLDGSGIDHRARSLHGLQPGPAWVRCTATPSRCPPGRVPLGSSGGKGVNRGWRNCQGQPRSGVGWDQRESCSTRPSVRAVNSRVPGTWQRWLVAA